MNSERDLIKVDRAKLAEVVRQAGGENVHKSAFRCPFHDDHKASAAIRQSVSTGAWYFYCYTCSIADDYFDLRARVEGRPVAEILAEIRETASGASENAQRGRQSLFVPKASSSGQDSSPTTPSSDRQYPTFATIDDLIAFYRRINPKIEITEVNPYIDPATGQPELVTLRYHKEPGAKKEFAQATPVEGGWTYRGITGDSLPLFNRQRLPKVSRVLLVEGEKKVRVVSALGVHDLAAVCLPGGATSAPRGNFSSLSGKVVYIWPDNDDPGRKFADEATQKLLQLTPPCIVYRIDETDLGLEPKGDVVDYLEMVEGTPADKVAAIEYILHTATPVGASNGLAERLHKIATGQYRLVPFIDRPRLTDETQALLPGTVTLLIGDPGQGKSFFILENTWKWVEAGESVKLLMLEEDSVFHQQRAVAQMAGESDFTDLEFVRESPTWAEEVFASVRDRIEIFSRYVVAEGTKRRTIDDIAKWVQIQAAEGVRVIIVDPITMAATSKTPWDDAMRFMEQVKGAIEKSGSSLIITTHPRDDQKPSLAGAAGGKAYTRFAQTVLWLRGYDTKRTAEVRKDYFTTKMEYSNAIEIRKCRNGKGAAKDIALKLNLQTLCFDELGVAERREK